MASVQQISWRRVLRPMRWWLLLVLALFAVHTHERMMDETRLYFSKSLNGNPVPYSLSITLDGKPVQSGQRLSLGKHHFEIKSAKTDPVSLDLSIWYGRHELGDIKLKRSMGTLAIRSVPPAQSITVAGPEFSTNIPNCTGMGLAVPTDSYTVQAQYPHLSQSRPVWVTPGTTASCSFAPPFGGVHLTCNETNATFELRDGHGNTVDSGNFPVTLGELPTGPYEVIAEHHQHQLQQSVFVNANATNDAPVEFQYGAVSIQSSPSGASIYGQDGRYWGYTPLFDREVTPQTLHFTLQMNGFETAPVELAVAADVTNSAYHELVSVNYRNNMADAQQDFTSGNYETAITAANQAMVAKPNDADALILRRSAEGLLTIQRAKMMATNGDYIGAATELTNALQVLPHNREAKQLLAYYKSHELVQAAHEAAEQLLFPRKTMDDFYARNPVAAQFEEHELKTDKPAAQVRHDIVWALSYQEPTFKVTQDYAPLPNTYEIEASQEVGGNLLKGDFGGVRNCIIVCGQTKTNETQILFKVMEYRKKHDVSMSGLLNFRDSISLFAISTNTMPMTDEVQAQLTNGVQIVKAKLLAAIK